MYAATCLVQIAVSKVGSQLRSPSPTLRAFASSVSSWLKLVHGGVVRMLQGFSISLFSWHEKGLRFCVRNGNYVPYLSQSSLALILNQFMYAAMCLELVQIAVSKVESQLRSPPPTLIAFASSVSFWLKRSRDIALNEETKISSSNAGSTLTLLGLTSSLSSLCSGAEYLLQIVHGAIPQAYFEPTSNISAADIATYILDYLYIKLHEACLVQGGEVVSIFSLLITVLDSPDLYKHLTNTNLELMLISRG